MATCSECGGSTPGTLTCRGRFDELLALEFSDVRAGQVHFLTVACYQLQHPLEFRLTGAGREQLLGALRDVVVGGVPVVSVRDRMRRAFEGDVRVASREGGHAAATRPTWSRTVMDLGTPDPSTHATRITEWASAILSDLGVA